MISDKLVNIARYMYKGRDRSHGINHALCVRNNALKISEELKIKDPLTLIKIEAAALYHDVWDHKYIIPNSEEHLTKKYDLEDKLKNTYFSNHDVQDIMIIIDNISLTKEMAQRNNPELLRPNLKHLQFMRDIVSDADKLEMLGQQGIDRVFQFEYYRVNNEKYLNHENFKRVFIEIYNRKIKFLIRDNYIITEPGRKLAEPLMKHMEDYVNSLTRIKQ